jgi:hypothetical protein
MMSEHEYLFGTKKEDSKVIDVKSNQDFPTLALGGDGGSSGGPLWSAPGQKSSGGKAGSKSFGKKTQQIGDSDWGASKNPFGQT